MITSSSRAHKATVNHGTDKYNYALGRPCVWTCIWSLRNLCFAPILNLKKCHSIKILLGFLTFWKWHRSIIELSKSKSNVIKISWISTDSCVTISEWKWISQTDDPKIFFTNKIQFLFLVETLHLINWLAYQWRLVTSSTLEVCSYLMITCCAC